MKKRQITAIVLLMMVPVISAFINPDENYQDVAELTRIKMGNQIFIGFLIVAVLIILIVYVLEMRKNFRKGGKKRRK